MARSILLTTEEESCNGKFIVTRFFERMVNAIEIHVIPRMTALVDHDIDIKCDYGSTPNESYHVAI